MSPDGALNHVEHTLPCSMFLRAHFAMCRRQDNSDSWTQEYEGHALSTKTLRSYVTRELHGLMHLDRANNGLDHYIIIGH